jgi:hypothetical protein
MLEKGIAQPHHGSTQSLICLNRSIDNSRMLACCYLATMN